MVTVEVFDQHQYGGDWPPESLSEAVAWFSDKLASVPEEHRASATLELESEGGYEGSHYGRIHIAYQRPETVDEVRAREVAADSRRSFEEAKERALLAQLQVKYGAKP